MTLPFLDWSVMLIPFWNASHLARALCNKFPVPDSKGDSGDPLAVFHIGRLFFRRAPEPLPKAIEIQIRPQNVPLIVPPDTANIGRGELLFHTADFQLVIGPGVFWNRPILQNSIPLNLRQGFG